MKLFKWIQGRQNNTQYKKFCLLYFKFLWWGFDCYILKYKANQQLPLHKDPVEGGRHFRINIKLKGDCSFWCPSVIWRWNERICIFRPDLFFHNLVTKTPVTKISIGFVNFRKNG